MSTIAAPHPGYDVAIVGDLGEGTLAHRIAWKAGEPKPGAVTPQVAHAACTSEPGIALSFGHAQSRGAKACPKCWGGRD